MSNSFQKQLSNNNRDYIQNRTTNFSFPVSPDCGYHSSTNCFDFWRGENRGKFIGHSHNDSFCKLILLRLSQTNQLILYSGLNYLTVSAWCSVLQRNWTWPHQPSRWQSARLNVTTNQSAALLLVAGPEAQKLQKCDLSHLSGIWVVSLKKLPSKVPLRCAGPGSWGEASVTFIGYVWLPFYATGCCCYCCWISAFMWKFNVERRYVSRLCCWLWVTTARPDGRDLQRSTRSTSVFCALIAFDSIGMTHIITIVRRLTTTTAFVKRTRRFVVRSISMAISELFWFELCSISWAMIVCLRLYGWLLLTCVRFS